LEGFAIKKPCSQEKKPAPRQKSSKERVTVLVCCNASGTHKLQLVCVGKSKKPGSVMGTEMRYFRDHYCNHRKPWMNQETFKD
jgi:hypothetical protein